MSLDVLRSDWLTSKKHEIAAVCRSHSALQDQLRAVTAVLASNEGLSQLLETSQDCNNTNATLNIINGTESLKSGGLLSGCFFDENTIPTPHIPQYDAASHTPKQPRTSTESSRQAQTIVGTDGIATEATLTQPTHGADPMAAAALVNPVATLPDGDDHLPKAQAAITKVAQSKAAVVTPVKVSLPSADDEIQLTVATRELLDHDSPKPPAKSIRPPPREAQEVHKREREEGLQDERGKSELDRATRPAHLQAQSELASSPSSTVGAYSAATPMPHQDSPDTSPDSDTAGHHALTPMELRPTIKEQRAKEEHDRMLAAQKESAHKAARGDEDTPDDQLRWEAREAAAREAEEQAARDDRRGPQANDKPSNEDTEAEDVMEDVQTEAAAPRPSGAAEDQDMDAIDVAQTRTAPDTQSRRTEDVGDNITVLSRFKVPHPIDTGRKSPVDSIRQRPKEPPVAPPPRMTTRVSSGAMVRRSVSDILGETPAQPVEPLRPRLHREATSPGGVSPTNTRHPQEHASIPIVVPLQQTPRRAARPQHQQTTKTFPTLNDLAPLKGAAEDPDRDYLEPLFRIQAHDSPQNKWTKSLPELVKMANKSMSTDDQFATLHERMDYKILRRVYHLQNANKWSLRQMEKSKEPRQPVTHWDHMMAEMKWMRKDFRAEKQMKKKVCAWLANCCAECANLDPDNRQHLQVDVKSWRLSKEKQLQERDDSKESGVAVEDLTPSTLPHADHSTPHAEESESLHPPRLIIAPELRGLVTDLQRMGSLGSALERLPTVGFSNARVHALSRPLATVSKFVDGKILPRAIGPIRKRSRYDYEDDAQDLEDQPESKRLQQERTLEPEEQDVALFHPENKHIRDRLHANNAFRPPSEFVMPSTSFYEFRNGSQWIWEDDQKLRKLAKEYSFNWSLIADEMTLLSRYKSAAERRTPWECFERWVELETLPAEMRKTLYFKTWFQRLEQSQQAAERRYQAQVAAIQTQAQQNGQQAHTPQRRRTVPTRVEKRKNTRYLWLVDAMRKLARKRENNAYKQAEAQRAAAQRKSQNDTAPQQRVQPMLTPQEFSKRRHERDLQLAEAQRAHRQKMIETQQRQMQIQRASQGGAPNGAVQQRPGTANPAPQHAQMQANGQQTASMNGQLPQQARPPLPMATRNGHLAVPQVNAQGIPQAQMRGGPMSHQDMQRLAQQNAQRNAQYPNQQQYQMPAGHLPSPGGGMTTQQQLQSNQQLIAQMTAQNQQHQAVGVHHGQGASHLANGHQMSASPSMPPPPAPHAQVPQPQQLSSGHVPALMIIKNQLRNKHPHLSEDQLNQAATSTLREQSQSQSSSTQVRQNAMNAAAGMPSQAHPGNMQAFTHNHNQTAFQNNSQMANGNTPYMNGDGGNNQTPGMTGPSQSPQAVAAYANQLRQRQVQMMRMQQSPNAAHAQLNGSPSLAHASPNMTPASPSMPYSQMNGQTGGIGGGGRPSSRGNTPQMQRLGSSNSVPGVGMASGLQSPGALPQGSPRNMQASMAR